MGATMYDGIEQALRDGGRLKAFRSGGGLRVVYIHPEGGENVAYGEHVNLEPALGHCDESFKLGKPSYKEQYNCYDHETGEYSGGKYDHYLTGTTEVTSPADGWVVSGHDLIGWFDADTSEFCVKAEGSAHDPELPKEAVARLTEDYERLYVEDDQGIIYRCDPCTFADDSVGYSRAWFYQPAGVKQDYFRQVEKTGRAPTFQAALMAAFEGGEPALDFEWKVYDGYLELRDRLAEIREAVGRGEVELGTVNEDLLRKVVENLSALSDEEWEELAAE